MNVIIQLNHPAQYHFFKNTIKKLNNDGHHVRVLIKTKDILEKLLMEDGVEYTNIQQKVRKNSKFAILFASVRRMLTVKKEAKLIKADLLAGTDSSIAQVGWLLRKPSLTTLEDDYTVIKNLARLTYPFTTDIVVPEVCSVGEKWEHKKVGYEGYMKLAYLHPNNFSPNMDVVRSYGIEGKYVLIRLAKLSAHHDVGIGSFDEKYVLEVIECAKRYGYEVYITSECPLNGFLLQYGLNIRFSDIHHVLAYSHLLVSDSQSMSVEAAMLGVPSIRFSDFSGKISVLEELEKKYKLTYGIETSKPGDLLKKTEELLSADNLRDEFQYKRQEMLADKIDVTAFFTWFIENYPESKRIMKENPDYQYRFK